MEPPGSLPALWSHPAPCPELIARPSPRKAPGRNARSVSIPPGHEAGGEDKACCCSSVTRGGRRRGSLGTRGRQENAFKDTRAPACPQLWRKR